MSDQETLQKLINDAKADVDYYELRLEQARILLAALLKSQEVSKK